MDLVEAIGRGFDDSVRHPWESARLEIVKKLIAEHAPLDANAVVVDIGCGDTFVAESLGRAFPHATFYAIDTAFTDELIARYRSRSQLANVRLFRSLQEIEPPIESRVSLILLMDVIEHVSDDIALMADLTSRSYVGPLTRFLITVPAYQSLFSSHDSFLGHYRRYSHRMLEEHAADAGLEVTARGSFFFSLLLGRLVQVARERLLPAGPRRMTSSLVTWRGGITKAAALKRLLLIDASASFFLKRLGINLAGLSHYAICRRSA